MTDKVHPVIEAMARAICEANDGNPDFVIEGQSLPNWAHYMDDAKAAAKVLLSMEPTEGMLGAAQTAWVKDNLRTSSSLYLAMAARAREEMGL